MEGRRGLTDEVWKRLAPVVSCPKRRGPRTKDVARVRAQGMSVVLPSRAKRRLPRVLDLETYARRNVIERLFGRLKQFRRVATRNEKTAASYAAALALAAALVVLSGWAA